MNRAQILVLALLALHLLLGTICLAAARGERSAPALRWWGGSLLIYAAGLVLTMQPWLPAAPSLALGNTLIAWAAIIGVEGVLANTAFRPRRRWAYIALAAVIAFLAYANFAAEPRPLLNLSVTTAVFIATFVLGSYWLLRAPPPAARTAAMFMAGTMLLAVAVWILRIAFEWNVARVTSDRDGIDLVISFFVIAQMVVMVACSMALLWIEARKMEMVLTKVALTDALTALPNRRAVMERFAEEESQAVRHGTQFALLILDIDNFRQINDRHGHATGDAVLRHVADCLAQARRAGDALGRVGSEEFVMLLLGDLAIAQGAAERLRSKVEASSFECPGAALAVTVSGGLALFPADGVDWDKLYAVADQRMHQSRRDGRNRVTSVSVVPTSP